MKYLCGKHAKTLECHPQGKDKTVLFIDSCPLCAAQQSVRLTALRRGLALSLFINVALLAVVLATIGGR